MNTDVRYALVGAFVVLLGIVALAIPLWWTGAADTQSRDTYLILTTEAVSGLNLNAPVKYRGVTVGEVAEIDLDSLERGRVRVRIEVRPETPVSTDTIATLTSQGITGLTYYELSGGDPFAPELEPRPGFEYPIIPSRPSLLMRLDSDFSSVIAKVNDVGDGVIVVADRLARLLDERNLGASAQALANIERSTASLDRYLAQLATSVADVSAVTASTREFTDSLPAIARNLEAASAELPTLLANATEVADALPGLTQSLERSLDELRRSSQAVSSAAGSVGALAQDSRASVDEVTQRTLPQVRQVLLETEALLRTLRRVGRSVERQPNSVIYGRGGRPGPGE